MRDHLAQRNVRRGQDHDRRQLAGRLASARLFDPEEVGYLLMRTLQDHEFRDFQDLAPWRELVPVFTEKIALFTGQHLIAVQTVLREEYWQELTAGFGRTELDIFHVLLHVDSDVLAERIKADEDLAAACQWRLDHISDYEQARPWNGVGRRPRHRRHAPGRRRESRALKALERREAELYWAVHEARYPSRPGECCNARGIHQESAASGCGWHRRGETP
jgi:hypothetical protein